MRNRSAHLPLSIESSCLIASSSASVSARVRPLSTSPRGRILSSARVASSLRSFATSQRGDSGIGQPRDFHPRLTNTEWHKDENQDGWDELDPDRNEPSEFPSLCGICPTHEGTPEVTDGDDDDNGAAKEAAHTRWADLCNVCRCGVFSQADGSIGNDAAAREHLPVLGRHLDNEAEALDHSDNVHCLLVTQAFCKRRKHKGTKYLSRPNHRVHGRLLHGGERMVAFHFRCEFREERRESLDGTERSCVAASIRTGHRDLFTRSLTCRREGRQTQMPLYRR